MSMKKKVEKFAFVITEIVNGYFVADQKLALLLPLLEDKELFGVWDGTAGVSGVEALRLTLYMAILSDMRALLFDNDKRAASLEQVVEALKNEHFVKVIRKRFCKPSGVKVLGHDDDEEMRQFVEEQVQDQQIKDAEETFDRLLPQTIQLFDKLKASKLASRVSDARSKMISHKEIRTVDGQRALYNPTDFGLKWGDASDVVLQSRDIIFNCNLLINNSSYDLDSFLGGHKKAASSFWGVAKNA
ncbi:hypothetical protein HOP53_03245 [Halomonas sp. MCCC 1A11081]|uniref:HEPN AbiU2-like domain-containing protein n=2 Tax=Billgrantia ethanolica TaxID=2733486 RepID=A0ABS8ZZ07_9GAMM|nr:hypothetical protein [Halomonas ethanolica]